MGVGCKCRCGCGFTLVAFYTLTLLILLLSLVYYCEDDLREWSITSFGALPYIDRLLRVPQPAQLTRSANLNFTPCCQCKTECIQTKYLSMNANFKPSITTPANHYCDFLSTPLPPLAVTLAKSGKSPINLTSSSARLFNRRSRPRVTNSAGSKLANKALQPFSTM